MTTDDSTHDATLVPGSRLHGIRVLRGGKPLFDICTPSTEAQCTPRDGASTVARAIARSVSGASVDVQILDPDGGDHEEKIDLLEARPNRSALFDGVLRVREGSTWLLRTFGTSWDISVAEVGQHGGLSRVPGRSDLRIWMLDDAVGQATLVHGSLRLPILVLSSKLPVKEGDDPIAAVDLLVAEVWKRHLALVRRLDRPTSTNLGAGRGPARSPIQTLMLLDYLLRAEGLAEAWDALAHEPRPALQITWPIRETTRARHPVLAGVRGPATIPGGIGADGEPRRVRDRTPAHTADTPPNRLAVRLAAKVEDLAGRIAQQLDPTWSGARAWKRRALAIRQAATAFRCQPVFQDVAPSGAVDLASTALRLDPLYRPMLRAWSLLEEGVVLPPSLEPLFRDPLKESYDLYEYWCWFALCDAVRKHATSTHLMFVPRLDTGGLAAAELPWGLRLVAVLPDGRNVEVHYNKAATQSSPYRSYSVAFRPDLAICIRGGAEEDVVILDAKYRVDVLETFEPTSTKRPRSLQHVHRRLPPQCVFRADVTAGSERT
ncbi:MULTISPECIES: nuclease domain-containing protein [Sorangium]|uniref:nuclease domain-containing protein n=1 Tax=Sorangium TaxID=39643 RepID=UPI003D9C61C6